MNYKAVFLDIDGTLVSFKTHQVPQTAVDAIRRIRRQGVKVFIATGRPLPFVDNLGELEYDGIMTVNGASIHTGDGTVIRHDPILYGDLRRLIDYYHTTPFPVAFATDETTFITGSSPEALHILQLLNIRAPQQLPIETCLNMDVMQMVAFFTPEQEPQLMADVFKGCTAQRWHPYFADVIRSGNNKARGIDTIIHHYGIPLDQTIAFGDGGNDMQMLRHAGLGIAMGNARDEVKTAAKYVTTSVDDDGIALALDKFIP